MYNLVPKLQLFDSSLVTMASKIGQKPIIKRKQIGQILPFEETQHSFNPFSSDDADDNSPKSNNGVNGTMDFQRVLCVHSIFRSFGFTYTILSFAGFLSMHHEQTEPRYGMELCSRSK